MEATVVKFKKWNCAVSFARYGNGRTAICLNDAQTGEPIAKATVNIPDDVEVAPDEVVIKSWSENEGMADALIAAGIIGPELRREPTGYCYATIHKLLIAVGGDL